VCAEEGIFFEAPEERVVVVKRARWVGDEVLN
jgi:hypothetical protein